MTDGAMETQVEAEGLTPEEKQYLKVAAVLAVLTGLEVAVYYVRRLPHAALTSMLAVLAIVKFAMVVLYFMHLRFDSRVFSRLFISGLVLALAVYMVVLSSFHVFVGGNPVLH